MKKIKDITLLVFAIIGFYTVISSFTAKPQDNRVIFEGYNGKENLQGPIKKVVYGYGGGSLVFVLDDGKFANVSNGWVNK